MKKITLQVLPSRVRILYGSDNTSDRYFIENELHEFCMKYLRSYVLDRRLNRYVPGAEYYVVDRTNMVWTIPRPFLSKLLEHFRDTNEYEVTTMVNEAGHKLRPIGLIIKSGYSDREGQSAAIEFLIQGKNDRRGLELQTGAGKTFCAMRAAIEIGNVTMIVVGSLVDQWTREVRKMTGACKNDVYVVQGFKSLYKLFNSKRRPKVFIMSLATLRNYVKHEGNYSQFPTYAEFIVKYGIGTKIVDEAHQALHAVSRIDMHGDVPTNIYLTATFITADKSLKRLFHTYFPNQMRYNDGYDKYVNIYGYSYDSNIRTTHTVQYGTYSHSKLEKIRLRFRNKLLYPFVYGVLCKLIDRHYASKDVKGKKLLIYFALRATIVEVAGILSKAYPQFKVVSFLSEDSDDILNDADIILSTHMGAGTGKDIKDLITVINTISYMAETLAKQTLGRLRKRKDHTPTYIDLFDNFNSIQQRHWGIRKKYFQACAKYFEERGI